MKPRYRGVEKVIILVLGIAAIAAIFLVFLYGPAELPTPTESKYSDINAASDITKHMADKEQPPETSAASTTTTDQVRYTGDMYHIFFHSLIDYPELAFQDPALGPGYRTYMVTRDEFYSVLDSLYKNNFVLIDIASIYKVNADGSVSHPPLFLPKGKKPLIVSLDDLNYYPSMKGHGFADKLVIDNDGNVATEVVTPEGKTEVTRAGDVVPILDDFVKEHPDFSIDGAKGIIAVTGFQGVLGYRTEHVSARNETFRQSEIAKVLPVVEKLKSTGWKFASHSYSHGHEFVTGSITLDQLKKDTALWKAEVEPLVGPTDIFIGPFGQIFKPYNERRQYLISQGFKMFCGVGMDLYMQYFNNQAAMDRADIDGFRLMQRPYRLQDYFAPITMTDTI